MLSPLGQGQQMPLDQLKRREFITLLGGAAAWPHAAWAQLATKLPLRVFVEAFLQGMREHGYVEGRQFDITYRFADGYTERLPALVSQTSAGNRL
jgi:putative ABC transport system substrate-binding protein